MGGDAPRSALESALRRIWSERGPAAWMLQLIALPYLALIALRRWLYLSGIFKPVKLPVPVLVVGNVVAGGAGKTPTVIALVLHLQARGHKVGVISRGYGRYSKHTLEVQADSRAQETGDEPLLIQRRTAATVFVGATRSAAALALLEKHPDTSIIVCDDGLQHYALYRDLEICVFDDRGTGNGWVLPAGPLREPWPLKPLACAGQSANRLLVLHTGRTPRFGGYQAHRFLADHAVRSDASTVALDAVCTGSKPVMAVAAIAQPELFFTMLRHAGFTLAKTMALPDHYDFDSWLRNGGAGYQLVCTEKDAAKLWQHAPDALAVPLVQTMGDDFWTALDPQLPTPAPTKLSFPHGHKTS